MVPVLDRQRVGAHQLEIGLVHQRRGVQQRHGLVLAQARAGQPSQVLVQQRKGFASGGLVTCSGSGQQHGQFGHGPRPFKYLDSYAFAAPIVGKARCAGNRMKRSAAAADARGAGIRG